MFPYIKASNDCVGVYSGCCKMVNSVLWMAPDYSVTTTTNLRRLLQV